MSASKEKKNRQAQMTDGWTDPKTEREARQRKEEKKSNILYGLIAVVFVVVAVVSLTWKSGIVQRSATAATIKGENYSSAEVEYYFRTVYQNFVSNNSSYLQYLGLDTSKDLKEQECAMSKDAGNWYNYFMDQALDQMAAVHALCDAADKDGYKWNDEMQESYDKALSDLDSARKQYNSSYGASLTTLEYLKALYGKIMTKGVYEEQLKLSILSQSYSNNYVTTLKYSDDELAKAYQKDPKSFDSVSYESVEISGAAKSTTDKDGKTVDPTDAEKTAALETAKKLADSFYASWKSGKSLSDLAKTDDTASYTDGKNGTYTDTVLMNWLFDDSRKAGDATVLEDKDGSAYYVAVFKNRARDEYNTVDVRHILIQPAEGTKKSGEDGYDEEQAELKAAAKAKAEKLLEEWKSGKATEDSFAELATKNSADTGSSSNGGLYEQVHKGQMVEAFESWCFDPARREGDTGIVETSYGYHVMYFVKEDLPYWKVRVTNSLKSTDYKEWYSAATKNYTAKQHKFGMQFVA
ncbi:MAG: peptidylprolyl isomerase [Oscillibacter sp.]|jgi:hypothetical protein|nr:peptidylprolyl isomerase [Oscillibacter sp.]